MQAMITRRHSAVIPQNKHSDGSIANRRHSSLNYSKGRSLPFQKILSPSNLIANLPTVSPIESQFTVTDQQSSPAMRVQAVPKFPQSYKTPKVLANYYSKSHKLLCQYDEEDTVDICKGAAALCMMRTGNQVGSGNLGTITISPSYSSSYSIMEKRECISSSDDSDSSATDSEDSMQLDRHTRPTRKRRRGSLSMRSRPTRLSLPSDRREVNSLHCFVRSDLLEITVVSPDGTTQYSVDEYNEQDFSSSSNTVSRCNSRSSSSSASSSSRPSSDCIVPSNSRLFPGRIGLRCVHCAHVHRKQQQTMASFHPKSIADLYRSVCTWQRVHFKECKHIPTTVREKYCYLKESDKSRGKTKYWASSAVTLGLVDAVTLKRRGGIRFED